LLPFDNSATPAAGTPVPLESVQDVAPEAHEPLNVGIVVGPVIVFSKLPVCSNWKLPSFDCPTPTPLVEDAPATWIALVAAPVPDAE